MTDKISGSSTEMLVPEAESLIEKPVQGKENDPVSSLAPKELKSDKSQSTVKSIESIPSKKPLKQRPSIADEAEIIEQSPISTDIPVTKPQNKTPETAKDPASTHENETTEADQSKMVAIAPKAKNVDLEKPIRESDIVAPTTNIETEPTLIEDEPEETSDTDKNQKKIDKKPHTRPFLLLGAEIPPGTSTRLSWSPEQSFHGISAPTPVLVVNGVNPGPVLCLTAAVHGDELNGIEIVRRILYDLEVDELSGTVVGVPIVNLQGFRRASRYLPDRRDLNRFFPGDPEGSSAARIAYSFFHEIISKCDALVDLHTGSFYRTNLPQLRADLSKPDVVNITEGFGATVILQSVGAEGTLRRAAVDHGIPAVTLEAGEPMRLQEDQVNHGVKGIRTLMNKLGMYDYSSFWGDPEPVYYKSEWVRANQGGILFSQVELGEKVNPGEQLGTITDPITNVRSKLISPYKGRIIGMALNQFVMPGFAAFHIGIQASEEEIIKQSDDSTEAADNHSSKIATQSKQKMAETDKTPKQYKSDRRIDSE